MHYRLLLQSSTLEWVVGPLQADCRDEWQQFVFLQEGLHHESCQHLSITWPSSWLLDGMGLGAQPLSHSDSQLQHLPS